MVKKAKAETVFEYITVKENNRNVTKKEQHGRVTAAAEKKAIYAGHNYNWKISWRDVEDLEFMDDGIRITTTKIHMECHNGTDGFALFRDFCQRRWAKIQNRMGPEDEKPAPLAQTKTRGVYGRHQYKTKLQKRHQAWGTNRIRTDGFSSEEDKQEPVEYLPTAHEEDRMEGKGVDTYSSGTVNDNDTDFAEESQDDLQDDDDKSLVKRHQAKKKKARITRKNHLDESDDDDALFDVAPDITTPKANRVVSPHIGAALQDDEDENEDDLNDKTKQSVIPTMQNKTLLSDERALSPSDAKGTKPLTSFFSVRLANIKKPVKSPARSEKAPFVQSRSKLLQKVPNGFVRTMPTCQVPTSQSKPALKQDREWLSTPSKSIPESTSWHFSAKKENDGYASSQETVVESPAADRATVMGLDYIDDDIKATPTKSSGFSKRCFEPFQTFQRDPGLKDDDLVDDSGESQPLSVADSVLIACTKKRPHMTVLHGNAPQLTFTATGAPLWKGLRNLGNTCYLNSSLQMLYTASGLITQLAGHGGDLAKSLVTVGNRLKDRSQHSSVTPKPVKTAIDAATDKFSGYEQRDAHEFLSDLIDRVHDELEMEEKEKETREDTHTLPTDEFFRLTVQACLKCDACGYERTIEELYRHLSIEVEEPAINEKGGEEETETMKWTVHDGFQKFFEPEKRDVICEQCIHGSTATQTLTVVNRPKALLVHLKRFVVVEKKCIRSARAALKEESKDACDNIRSKGEDDVTEEQKKAPRAEMTIQKIKAPVIINESVSLSQYVAKPDGDAIEIDANYGICSIIHHLGSTASSGHYTADAVRATDDTGTKWVHFDDGVATATNKERLLKSDRNQRTAYLLLYIMD